ncbi:hypothetical protein TgHK011_001134 [Trichoderma gracile]|nr:hypothetical protein TgHK011_001134 [Trichoderma gracile]
MLLLRILASLLFHLPIVLSIPHHTTTSLSSSSSSSFSSSPRHHHHHRYNRSLEAFVVAAPLPPPPPPQPTTTTVIEPIPFPLPPTTSFPLPPPPPTTTSDPWKDMCLPGQECDCSRIKDKNGEEYFQCVTNPRCDHCWINITTTTTTSSSPTSLPSFSTPITLTTPATKNLLSSSTDYRTLLPGTYTTSSAHGTAHVVVVQQPASIHFVTLTVTKEVRVTPLCEAVGSGAE